MRVTETADRSGVCRAARATEIDERDRKDYFTPSTACFRDFCEGCIRRYGLHEEHVIRQETVADVDFDIVPQIDEVDKVFCVLTDKGRHFARAVVLAVGGGEPVIPPPFPTKLPGAASHAMWMDEDCVLSEQLQSKVQAGQSTNALVVGGGLTSAQIADCLVRKGVSKVHLVMRGPWKGEPPACFTEAVERQSVDGDASSETLRRRPQLDEQVP